MPAPPLPIARKPASLGAPAPTATPVRVFICDDDAAFAMEMAEALAAHGFTVRPLGRATPPVESMRDFRPDVLLLDIFMPAPNGFEILNMIREDDALRGMPLILISGTDTGLLDVAKQFCAGHRLELAGNFQKPLRVSEIARLCAQAGAAHQARAAAQPRRIAPPGSVP